MAGNRQTTGKPNCHVFKNSQGSWNARTLFIREWQCGGFYADGHESPSAAFNALAGIVYPRRISALIDGNLAVSI